MMTDEQKVHSSLREKAYSKLSEEMLTALENGEYDLKLEVKQSGSQEWRGKGKEARRIKGTVGNQQIDVTSTRVGTESGIHWESSGSVNGEKVSDTFAREIWGKYNAVAQIQDIGKKGFFGFGKKPSVLAGEAKVRVDEVRRREEYDEQQRKSAEERNAQAERGAEEERARKEAEEKIRRGLI